MTDSFSVEDRRGRRGLDTSVEGIAVPRTLPASMNEEVKEVKMKPGEQFIHPSAGRVLIQEDVALGKVGKIWVPDKVQKRPTTGTILEVGKGVEDYVAGQKIVYGLYSGTVLTYKGWDPKTRINFRMLSVEEILGWQDEKAPELEGVGT
jgi:co-chaperonin GroES (HSP10)